MIGGDSSLVPDVRKQSRAAVLVRKGEGPIIVHKFTAPSLTQKNAEILH